MTRLQVNPHQLVNQQQKLGYMFTIAYHSKGLDAQMKPLHGTQIIDCTIGAYQQQKGQPQGMGPNAAQ